jgi:hypothetical protein
VSLIPPMLWRPHIAPPELSRGIMRIQLKEGCEVFTQ